MLNTFGRLPPELRSIAYTRPCLTTTANWSRGYSSVKLLRLKGTEKQKEVASPLSPLSNPASLKITRRRPEASRKQPLPLPPTPVDSKEAPKSKKPRWDHGRNGVSPQPRAASTFTPQSRTPPIQSRQARSTKNTTPPSTRKFQKEITKKAPLPPARPSKGVDGVSTTRTLLIQPATDRTSRVPIWARPASSTIKNRRDKRKLAPSGLSWSEHTRQLRDKYGAWTPNKKISHDAMDGVRLLYRTDPQKYSLPVLAQRFKISPEAIRRILRSKWRLSPEEREGKLVKERKRRAERLQMMRESEMHQMVMAGIKLKVHPDDKLQLR